MMKALTSSRRPMATCALAWPRRTSTPLVNSSQFWISAHGYLARFDQQESQQPRSLFADRTNPPPFTRAVLDRIETNIGGHLAWIGEPFRVFQRMRQT